MTVRTLSGVALAVVAVTSMGSVWGRAATRFESGSSSMPAKTTAAGAASQVTRPVADGTFLAEYCVACHNQRLKTAGLMLDVADVGRIGEQPELWEKVAARLRSGSMPPAGRPRAGHADTEAFVSRVEGELDRAAAGRTPLGAPRIRRLNRVEYANAIRDLLALEIDAAALLPADTSGYGFDNIAAVLSVSPGLLERYMTAAAHVSRLALGDPTGRASIDTYKVSKTLVQTTRTGEDLPFGSRGGIATAHYFPLDGDYTLKVRLVRNAAGRIRGLGERSRIQVRLDGTLLQGLTIGGPHTKTGRELDDYLRTADDALEVRFSAPAGSHRIGVSFEKESAALAEGLMPAQLPITTFSYQENLAGITAIDSVQITGPVVATGPGDTASRRRILVCRPERPSEEATCARRIFATLARRALRRPVTEADLAPLVRVYDDARTADTFERGIQAALESLLVDPEFLFRIESDPPPGGSAVPANDFALASRLSFFLWSSLPDDELLDAAARGQLAGVGLERQVRRMLADRRASALVRNFVGQWLQVRNMRAVTPDPNAFPDFDDNLREAFERETYLFVENEFREDRSVSHLLTADYTFVNERLARHYGISGIHGAHFRRVTFRDGIRGGLLGQGAILTVTSHPNRTSPVLRGKFLLGNILGFPPPPPPPNVSDLPDRGEDGAPRSVRARLEQHRKNPACASCHAPMDPLGFALENFDGIGQWRTRDAGLAIDASGLLPDGTTFSGPTELRRVLQERRRIFVGSFAERLLAYALGRGLDYRDRPAVRQVVRLAAEGDDRWSSLILGVVRSAPFQSRKPS